MIPKPDIPHTPFMATTNANESAPHSRRALLCPNLVSMKAIQEKKNITLGEFIMAAYDTWGKRRARGVVKLAIKMHLVQSGESENDAQSRRDCDLSIQSALRSRWKL